MARSVILLFICLFITACGPGSGDGLDQNGQPASDNTAFVLTADFNSIQQNVFTPICTVCHAGASAPLGLRLDAENSYAALVNVSSVQDANLLRITPNDPTNSYLIQKIVGNAAVGGQMPLGGPALPQATIDVIRQWITNGALPASTTPPPVTQPPTVSSTNPADASNLTALPASINVLFSQEMDATSINNSSVMLQRSGEDGVFNNGNEVNITPNALSLSTTNPALLTIDLGGIPSVDDTYRLTLVGNGATPLQDLNSNALDGDNDGIAGGDHIISFIIQAPGGSGLQPTWRSIQDYVFTPVCIVCHSGSGAPEGLQLDEANSYSMLVNVASQQVPSILRVAPNDANNSYLIQKLEGTASSGSQMPRGGPPLPQETINIIRQWIDAGATQDTSPPPPPPVNTDISITVTVPASVNNGDEFLLSTTITNNGSSTVNDLNIKLSWLPQSSLRLRIGDATQNITSLDAGQSATLNWTLRAEEIGTASMTVTVSDNTSQTLGSHDADIIINN